MTAHINTIGKTKLKNPAINIAARSPFSSTIFFSSSGFLTAVSSFSALPRAVILFLISLIILIQ